MIPNAAGRPNKVDMRVVIKLVDLIQHNYTIAEACNYAGISRQTYYHYLNSNSFFRNKMMVAKGNQNKVVTNFLTTY